MTPETSFNYGVVSPVECLKAGWAVIKDRYWLFVGITLVATLLGAAREGLRRRLGAHAIQFGRIHE